MLFFDIETKTNPLNIQFIDPPSAPGNYKDPEKIQKYQDEKMAELIAKGALDSDIGYIVAIGYQEDDQLVQSVTINEMTEKEMVNIFWNKYREHGGFCCGYNIIGFDLPYLMKRAFELRVQIVNNSTFTKPPYLGRYQTEPVRDLMGILYNWNSFKSLKWVAKRYGLNNPLPELEGSQVENMDNETLKAYVSNDVHLVKQLSDLMSGVYF